MSLDTAQKRRRYGVFMLIVGTLLLVILPRYDISGAPLAIYSVGFVVMGIALIAKPQWFEWRE